jgi:glycosyltransferase involved in cell wall biosynthesis
MMAHTPDISVVIPVFNGARFIHDAIQSVLDQTCPVIEIIVVDDGSTDTTRDVVQRMGGAVPIRYHFQDNQGPSVARNLGVSLASSPWVAFLDADDVWLPSKIAVAAAHVQAHPESSFLYSDVEHVDAANRPRTAGSSQLDRDFHAILFHDQPVAFPSTVLIRKEVFLRAGGFAPSLRFAEDWHLYCRLASFTPFSCIPGKLVRRRKHPSQLTRQFYLKPENWSVIYDHMRALWGHDPKKMRCVNHKTAQVYANVGKHYLIDEEVEKARHYLRLSLRYRPWWWTAWRRLGLTYLPAIRTIYRNRKRRKPTFLNSSS